MNSKEALDRLKDIAGEEIYNNIIKELSGATVYFPANLEWTDKEERNEKLREDFYSGKYEIPELARKYDLSISRVYKIIQTRGI